MFVCTVFFYLLFMKKKKKLTNKNRTMELMFIDPAQKHI